MIKIVDPTTKEQFTQMRRLYNRAFPKAERKPFSMLMKIQGEGMHCIEENGKFCGLVIMMLYDDIALLDYFAVSEDARNHGIGSRVLHEVIEKYKDRRFMLEIESTKIDSPDREMRESRKGFYLRAGLAPEDYEVMLFGVRMEIMTYNCHISYEDYHSMYEHILPEALSKKVKSIDTQEDK